MGWRSSWSPRSSGDGVPASILGLVAGFVSGLSYAGFALVVKGTARHLESVSLVLAECTLDGLFILPLALWQTLGAGYVLTGRDLLVALVLGLVCTAVAYTLWMEGTSRVRVQHSAVLGFYAGGGAHLRSGPPGPERHGSGRQPAVPSSWPPVILVVLRGQGRLESEPPV